MQRIKQVVGVVFGVGVVLGLKFYNKSGAHDEMKAKLITVCEKDDECVTAVNTHFDACFDDNYDMGGRRRAASVNTDGFLACFNEKAGKQHFSVNQKEQTAH